MTGSGGEECLPRPAQRAFVQRVLRGALDGVQRLGDGGVIAQGRDAAQRPDPANGAGQELALARPSGRCRQRRRRAWWRSRSCSRTRPART